MLYEMIAVVRTARAGQPSNLPEVKEIARTAGSLILAQGGTIRGIKNWGVFSLPKKTTKHQLQHSEGHYFVMRYDASSKTQDTVRTTLGLDPRMIKFSTVKLGVGTLESLSRIGGSMAWSKQDPDSLKV
ncbi:37S ribosomal protein-like protein Mrp17 [Calycina marina]|uniref:Small ribosomal subunit protein bS6m n=1 Tax=Calycina marina TaxID=1763456 RepID=A0A9P8CKU2_9HELO|nr:37S ribosomal protein-like protein Mrp17 [Calycina marina]